MIPCRAIQANQSSYLHTIVAVAAEQNFCDVPKVAACCLALFGELDLIHARNGAAFDANEVGMRRMCLPLSGDDFKSPNVIAEF